ncbi:TetR/AcrR family transcriptional regulator [Aeromicrobium tamlense]|uniref:AcrR family transcriptional regulator n=1 Tax=Aeromicrobium tamlense TaxID=375541 RepID=A0A8I0KJF8_9ACTN|nr:TetR/AcrR family transcriptional regulator [Aeromicrobium tamlense]MBD1271970.1 TetR/AcrR family transcriptional regulator [Aeromicrobium tamlense]NYI38840.1 AcrR family transcriptional regulator [Aeromicrobium tamlense]
MTQTPEARPRAGRLPRTARRAQLLDVALDVFVEQGYHAASMDEIAERAGVSKPVLYQHFPGKLDLYTALVSSAVDTVIEGVREALASTQDNRERVQASMRLWYDSVADREKAFRLVFESDLTSDPEVRELVDRVTSESAAAIADVIVEDTGLSQGAAELLAAGLVGMGHVGARAWLSGASGLSRDDAVTLASTLAWRGIGGFPKPTNQGDE